MSLLFKGIRLLSELKIDADKDWRAKGISNLKELASGMPLGSIVQSNSALLERLDPGSDGYVLTSQGPGKRVVWSPGGTYFDRFFPVTIDLDKAWAKVAPNYGKSISVPLESTYEPQLAPDLAPGPGMVLVSDIVVPDGLEAVELPVLSSIFYEMLLDGAVSLHYASNFCTGGSATADSDDGVNTPDKAFDNDTGTRWTSADAALPHWIKYDLGVGVTKTARRLNMKPYSGGSALIRNFALEGSNNDADWDTLYSGTCGNTDNWQFFVFDNATAYRYYRITISTVYGAGDIASIYEIQMNEAIEDDELAASRSDTVNDMHLCPSTPATGDIYYFGCLCKFRQLQITVSTAGVGNYAIEIQYWNGADWVTPVGLIDDLNDFQSAGVKTAQWTAPSPIDWAL
jgi:hypothetical protein